MTLDLTQFHEIFFEESFEALDSMEAALLKLSAGEVDAELINTIFRVAHSIKGGAATFAFNEVAGFTHVLETLLDQLRAGKRQVRPDIVDVLLRSGDPCATCSSPRSARKPSTARASPKLRAELDRIMGEAAQRRGRRQRAGRRAFDAGQRRRRRRRCADSRLAHQVRSRPRTAASRQRSAAHAARAGDARPSEGIASMPSGVPPLTDLDPEDCRLRWNLEVQGDDRRSRRARRCSSGRKANAN